MTRGTRRLAGDELPVVPGQPADPSPGVADLARHIATLGTTLHRLDAVLSDVVAARQGRGGPHAAGRRVLVALAEHPAGSRFRSLAEAHDLTQVELDLLLLGLAPDLDVRYGDVFGWLQDDGRRRRPGIALALDLLGLTPGQRLATRSLFGSDAALVRSGLLRVTDPSGATGRPFPDRELAVDDRLAAFVSGDDALDAALAGIVDVVDLEPDGLTAGDLVLAEPVRRNLERLAAGPAVVCHLQGPEGSGRQAAAEVLARGWGARSLLRVRTDRLPDDHAAAADLVRRIGREIRLRGAAVYWEDFDGLLDDERAAVRALVEGALAGQRQAFVGSTRDWSLGERPPAAHLDLARPDAALREVLWHRVLGEPDGSGPSAELAAVAAAFRLGPAGIAAAAAEARVAGPRPTAAELAAAARRRGSAALGRVAQRVPQTAGWSDLVLPADRMERLHALCARVRHRALVQDRWGFAGVPGAVGGVVALFTGPSGTGKTMAAGVLAGALGLELYRVDLAGVVSKYIGETEKNLERVFAAAEASDAVLFFDEADALFGKRTEVRDAHDRYANVEVSYLLQRIERHDGVVVLATNLRKNLDEAFQRRFQCVVEFPLPDRPHRRRIWQRVFPAAAPLDPALDLDLLADRFELSGGSIRNIAVEAAFAAAAEDRPIGPDHVASALRHEHQKLGRVAAAQAWQDADGRGPLVRSAG